MTDKSIYLNFPQIIRKPSVLWRNVRERKNTQVTHVYFVSCEQVSFHDLSHADASFNSNAKLNPAIFAYFEEKREWNSLKIAFYYRQERNFPLPIIYVIATSLRSCWHVTIRMLHTSGKFLYSRRIY